MILNLPACSQPSQEEQAWSQQFFTALQHLCEADTLEADGKIQLSALSFDYSLWLDQNSPLGLALQVQAPASPLPSGNTQASFYIQDGRTYLDYFGEKSSSLAINIGLLPGSRLSIYNPFLDLDAQQRADLFTSIQKEGDALLFSINKDKLSVYLDSYGSALLDKAEMKVVFQGEEIQNLDLVVQGTIQMDGETAPLDVHLVLHIESMNEPVTIPYPKDLASWNS